MRWMCVLFSVLVFSGESFPQPFTLVNAFPNLTFTRPLLVTHAGDGTNRVFVVQQNGLIRMFQNDSAAAAASTFLNIANKLTSAGNEQGLLGLAFHPNFKENGYLYVNYTATGTGRTVVARYSLIPGNPNKADSLSEVKLLEVYQPFTNHNAGMILFGNDGHLYVTMGDGGSGGDPGNRAQNVDSLLGKILRINVDSVAGPLNYSIPQDNPFVGGPGRDEIYATGMRNPWRMSVDPITGQIWIGDVGQNAWEEIDLLAKGKNYGWRCYEGNATYNTSGCGPISNYTFPVKVYPRSSPECSVTGGYIYRGHRRPDLVGAYVYADYCSGKIWRFRYNGGVLSDEALLIDAPFSISSFGTDELGEIYICNLGGGTIHRFAGGPATANTTVHLPSYKAVNVGLNAALRWNPATGVIAYWLQVASDPSFDTLVVSDSTLIDTSFAISGLSNATQYYWRVRVKNANGWGIGTNVWSFTTANAPPAAPTLSFPADGITAVSTSPTVGWTTGAGATSYRVQVFPDSMFTSPVFDATGITGLSVSIPGLQHSTVYYWRVRSVNPGGESQWTEYRSFRTWIEATNLYEVEEGWNLVSLPLNVTDPRSSSVFPTSHSGAFRFGANQGYYVVDSLRNGLGYWVKFDSLEQVGITGIVRERDTIDVVPGWNLIGASSMPVDTSEIVQVPPGVLLSPFYSYDKSSGVYQVADSLHPGTAYWVKAAGTGQLVLLLPPIPRPSPEENAGHIAPASRSAVPRERR